MRNQALTLHSRIKVKITKQMPDGTEMSDIVESTLGRFIFNEVPSSGSGFVDRSVPENALKLEVDFHVSKKGLEADSGKGYQYPWFLQNG